ncbi:thrombospondin type-1 domain-containing protein 1 [Gastrophryne carolinensis]
MRKSLCSVTYVVLLFLWGSAFVNASYLNLQQSYHTALSKASVYVEFYVGDYFSITTNATISLLDTKSKVIVTSKELPGNQSEGILEFECIYLMSAGLYQFQMSLETQNDSSINIMSSLLNITWPIFYIDLNRTSKDMQRSFQVGVFTNEQLCSGSSVQESQVAKMLLEVEHTQSFQGLEEPNTDHFMLYKTYKEIPLTTPQWVEFECASLHPEAYITVSLKPIDSESVIAHIGPVDLVKTFKYKMLTVTEKKCDSSVTVNVIPPPCNYVEGKMIVYKEYPRSPGEEVTTLSENTLLNGERTAHFNCSLFEIGKNKYCFEFLVASSSSPNYSFPRTKQCAEIRREIETWSLWQPWSSCSSTCGHGQRERYRTCLSSVSANPLCRGGPAKETSICSLDDCLTVKPSSKSTTNTDNPKTSNTVTITGISLCLFIIFTTVVITIWRKFGKTGKCSPRTRHSSSHSVNCWKSSDEENICQARESFSDAGEGQPEGMEDGVNIPLNYRQNIRATEEAGIEDTNCPQANSQKMVPPIFGYRLAQQQLKEMKQKGLTQTTKVYHVSQNPMADTALDVSLVPSLVSDNCEEVTANKFRIQSPFLEAKHNNGTNAYSNFPAKPGFSPSQTLPKVNNAKSSDVKVKYDRCYQKNSFRRTSSFHETKHIKPYRERSLTSLSPRQAMIYNSRTRMWVDSTIDRSKQKQARMTRSPENLTRGISLPLEATGHLSKNQHVRPEESRPDLICSRNVTGRTTKTERPEQNRLRKGPSPVERSWKRGQNVSPYKDISHRNSPQSPAHYRREKCQSFPWGAEFSFYDNSTFGLTEAEQEMLDLPGYFASNEEDETSTLSIERLVI